MTTTSERNRPRYAYVRSPADKGQAHALYDIVDNGHGTEQVMAYSVRYQPAVKIVEALNDKEKLHNFFTT